MRLRRKQDDEEGPQTDGGDTDGLITGTHKGGRCTPARLLLAAVVVAVATVLPLVVYLTVFSNNPDFVSQPWTCDLKQGYRVPCMEGRHNLTEALCASVGCCYDNQTCFHSLPAQQSYSVSGDWGGNSWAADQLLRAHLDLVPRFTTTPYGKQQVGKLRVFVAPLSETQLRMLVYDPAQGDPPAVDRGYNGSDSDFQLAVFGPEYFSLRVSRRGAPLFSTSWGPLIASDNYWELALQFPAGGAVFGLGGLALSAEPQLLYNSGDRLGALPFVISLDAQGSAHGVLFHGAGPLEFRLLQPSQLLVVRSLATLPWDLTVLAGPTPADVTRQLTALAGMAPAVPPPWALGLHVCRDTGGDNVTLALQGALDFTRNATATALRYETDCVQERLLAALDLRVPGEMQQAVEELRAQGRRFLASLPPQVDAALAGATNSPELFVTNGTLPLEAQYRGRAACYPDVLSNVTASWLRDKVQGLGADGLVLQDNWPAAHNNLDIHENLDYLPVSLSNGTLPWLSRHGSVDHYLVHNRYGLEHSRIAASVGGVGLVLSAATFTGSGAVSGSHALAQAVANCTWGNMKAALGTALGHGLAGVPLSGGGAVCGDMGDYDDELCLRWYMMSSLLPLMRVSSEEPLRDPLNLKTGYSRKAVLRGLELRYSLVAHMYSLLLAGLPIARPTFYNFPADAGTWDKDQQFMIGEALIVRPAFLQGAVSVVVYLPQEGPTVWYHLEGGQRVNNGTVGEELVVTTMDRELVVLLRGGYIVPRHNTPGTTVEGTLSGPLTLVVGLNCSSGDECRAEGGLALDQQGSRLQFQATARSLRVNGTCVGALSLEAVTVYGLDVTSCSVAGGSCVVREDSQAVEMTGLGVQLCGGSDSVVDWETSTETTTTTAGTGITTSGTDASDGGATTMSGTVTSDSSNDGATTTSGTDTSHSSTDGATTIMGTDGATTMSGTDTSDSSNDGATTMMGTGTSDGATTMMGTYTSDVSTDGATTMSGTDTPDSSTDGATTMTGTDASDSITDGATTMTNRATADSSTDDATAMTRTDSTSDMQTTTTTEDTGTSADVTTGGDTSSSAA